MTFIKKIKPERTCKDFKPSFIDRNGCRLTHLCADARNHWKEFGRCVGLKPQELLSPKGIKSGVSLEESGMKKGGHNPPPSRKKPSTPPPSQKAKKRTKRTNRTKPTMRDSIKKR